jgi:ketosteroid isomerase-like protein
VAQKNVQSVRDAVEAYNRGDLDAALGRLHPDVEWRTLDAFPDAGTYRGPEGVRDFFQTWNDTFEGFRLHLDECVALDEDLVLATLRVSGKGAGSGAEVESPAFFQIVELRDGLVIRARMFETEDEALEAAGTGIRKQG